MCSQSESSTENPKSLSVNRNGVSQCWKTTQTLSSRVEDPSQLSAPLGSLEPILIHGQSTIPAYNQFTLLLLKETYLLSPLSKITNPENISQFKLVKDTSSNRVNALLINETIRVNLFKNCLTFSDTDKDFELQDDFFKKRWHTKILTLILLNYRIENYCIHFSKKIILMKEL